MPLYFREAEEPAWLDNIDLCPFKEILKRILYQTIESIADSQWELRRMGQQVSYEFLLFETIWLWIRNLPCNSVWMTSAS